MKAHHKRRWDESKHVVVGSAITIGLIFALVFGLGLGVKPPAPTPAASRTLER